LEHDSDFFPSSKLRENCTTIGSTVVPSCVFGLKHSSLWFCHQTTGQSDSPRLGENRIVDRLSLRSERRIGRITHFADVRCLFLFCRPQFTPWADVSSQVLVLANPPPPPVIEKARLPLRLYCVLALTTFAESLPPAVPSPLILKLLPARAVVEF